MWPVEGGYKNELETATPLYCGHFLRLFCSDITSKLCTIIFPFHPEIVSIRHALLKWINTFNAVINEKMSKKDTFWKGAHIKWYPL